MGGLSENFRRRRTERLLGEARDAIRVLLSMEDPDRDGGATTVTWDARLLVGRIDRLLAEGECGGCAENGREVA